jgi:Lrp/AsnC family transcriptional regulator of ectoine degradation
MTVICPTLTAFQELMQAMLDAELGVDRYMTYIVTRKVKSTRPNIPKLVAASGR